MNHGIDFYHPNESHYNMYRRALIANPVYRNSKNRVKKCDFLNALDRQLKKFPDKPIYQIVGSITSSDIAAMFEKVLYCERQCPDCARLIFHTPMFLLNWIKRCPVHGKDLVRICPECNQAWPSSKELDLRDCRCCGSTPPDESYVARKEVQKELEKRFGILQLVVDKFNKSSEYVVYMRDNGFSRASVTVSHQLIGAFLRSAGEMDDDLAAAIGFDSPLQNIKTCSFAYVEAPVESLDLSTDTLQQIRFAKLHEIVTFLNGLTDADHLLHEGCLYDLENACPYCYALGLWYKLVFFNSESALVKQLGIKMPRACFVLRNLKFIRLPEDIQQILYEKNLEMCFRAIFSGILFWLNLEHKSDSGRPVKLNSINYPTLTHFSQFEDFWFQETEGQIAFHYSDDSILTEANFALQPAKKYQCSFDKQEYYSPKISGLFNRVWLLGLDVQILSNYKEPCAHLNPQIGDPIYHQRLPFE